MAGGLIQVVAYSTQDIFLTGNPQITFFKSVYKRYTNFAIEAIQIFFDDHINFGRKVTATVPRNGDLMHTLNLEIIIPEINIPKIPSQEIIDIAQQNLTNATNNLLIVNNFMQVNVGSYRIALFELEPLNNT